MVLCHVAEWILVLGYLLESHRRLSDAGGASYELLRLLEARKNSKDLHASYVQTGSPWLACAALTFGISREKPRPLESHIVREDVGGV